MTEGDADSQSAGHDYFMGEALALAKAASDIGEVPVGAVIVRDGEITGRGYNHSI